MLFGQGEGMSAWRMETLGQGLSQKKYVFQVRNDDGRDHFLTISRRYPDLIFQLTYDDAASGEFGSYLIRNCRAKAFLVPQKVIDSVMLKHNYDYENDEYDSENERRYWEASWELMDLAESHWLTGVVKRLRRDNPEAEPGGR
jgi:hypothetical protein